MQKFTDKVDYKKLSRSFIPNYIQYLDAVICSYIVTEMKSKEIPLITVHIALNVRIFIKAN